MRIGMSNEAERDEQRQWIRAVARKLGISVSQLAREAELAPSTLNRFLNQDVQHLLENETLAAVAKVGGVEILELPGRPRGLAEEATPFDAARVESSFARAVKALTQERNGLAPYVVRGFALDLMGYVPGDVVIVDLNRQPKTGDVVLAQRYHWERDSADTLLRLYEKPLLLTVSSRGILEKPVAVDDDQVVIKGVVGPRLNPGRSG